MIYLDSSVLVKRYVQETGSAAVITRFESGETIYTSVLSFAEVHATIGRKHRNKQLSVSEKKKLVDEFLYDWLFSLTVLELTTHTMSALPELCVEHFLKASDAVHLSAAIWLRDSIRIRAKGFENSDRITEFGTSDLQLGKAVSACGFQVFDPK